MGSLAPVLALFVFFAELPNLVAQVAGAARAAKPTATYTLGPDDEVSIWALGITDLPDKPVRIDPNGYVDLPLVGRIRAGGLTVEQFKADLVQKLQVYVKQPEVSVRVTDSRSEPVSVVGAVKSPGIVQLQGTKNLVEVLSLAGGLTADAGDQVKLTRSVNYGRIPLSSAKPDDSGQFTVAEVSLRRIMQATNPEENTAILPHDVITVPRAELVYVIGQVNKPGGFPLQERSGMTILEALALAGGVTRTAAGARILRPSNDGIGKRSEVTLDLKGIMGGKREDIALKSGDILFIPNSATKNASLRALETAIQLGTGLAVFR